MTGTTETAKREYELAAEPFITPVSGQVRREIMEFADGHRAVILVVSNDDAMDVLEALRRAYVNGQEERGSEDEPMEPLMTTHQGYPVDARDNIPKG